jgi:hypothetical protein
MVQNKGSAPNTPPFPEVQPPNPVVPSLLDDEDEDELTKLEIVE